MMVSIGQLPPVSELAAAWHIVSASAQHSFFLSWPWIRTWLACLPKEVTPNLLTISQNGSLIALALLTKTDMRRRGIISARTWVLNATGKPALDQIFIEHNGLLAEKGYELPAWNAWAQFFARNQSDWDEIKFRGVAPDYLSAWSRTNLSFREEMALTSRFLDLAAIRTSGLPYLSSINKKTRAYIRKTKDSLTQRFGEIRLDVAGNLEEALFFFEELKTLHQLRWTQRSQAGAFSYPFFEKFHRALISGHFEDGVIQLLRVRTGKQTVGILYNFLHHGNVTVYQTGFNYRLLQSPNRESPGLLTHTLAIEFNISLGYQRYDLLAGDSSYKRALTNQSESLWWGTIQRPRLKFRAEALLERSWRRLFRRETKPL